MNQNTLSLSEPRLPKTFKRNEILENTQQLFPGAIMRGTRRPIMRIQQWPSRFHDPRPTAQNILAEGQHQPMGRRPTKI